MARVVPLKRILDSIGVPSAPKEQEVLARFLSRSGLTVENNAEGDMTVLVETGAQLELLRKTAEGLKSRYHEAKGCAIRPISSVGTSIIERIKDESSAELDLRKLISDLGVSVPDAQKKILLRFRDDYGFELTPKGSAKSLDPAARKLFSHYQDGVLTARDLIERLDQWKKNMGSSEWLQKPALESSSERPASAAQDDAKLVSGVYRSVRQEQPMRAEVVKDLSESASLAKPSAPEVKKAAEAVEKKEAATLSASRTLSTPPPAAKIPLATPPVAPAKSPQAPVAVPAGKAALSASSEVRPKGASESSSLKIAPKPQGGVVTPSAVSSPDLPPASPAEKVAEPAAESEEPPAVAPEKKQHALPSADDEPDLFVRRLFLIREDFFELMPLFGQISLEEAGVKNPVRERERRDLIFKIVRGVMPLSVVFFLRMLRWDHHRVDDFLKSVSDAFRDILGKIYVDLDANVKRRLATLAEACDLEKSLKVIEEYPLNPDILEACIGTTAFNAWLKGKSGLMKDVVGADQRALQKSQLGKMFTTLPTHERVDNFINIEVMQEANRCDERLSEFLGYFRFCEDAGISNDVRLRNKNAFLTNWNLKDEQLEKLIARMRSYKRLFNGPRIEEIKTCNVNVTYRLLANLYGRSISDYIKENCPTVYNTFFAAPFFALDPDAKDELFQTFFKSSLSLKEVSGKLDRIDGLRMTMVLLAFLTGKTMDEIVQEFDREEFGQRIGRLLTTFSEDIQAKMHEQCLVGKLTYEGPEVQEASKKIFPYFSGGANVFELAKNTDLVSTMSGACMKGVDWKIMPNDAKDRCLELYNEYMNKLRGNPKLEEDIKPYQGMRVTLAYLRALKLREDLERLSKVFGSHKTLSVPTEKGLLLADCVLHNEFFNYQEQCQEETTFICEKIAGLGKVFDLDAIDALKLAPPYFPGLVDFFRELFINAYKLDPEPFYAVTSVLVASEEKLEVFTRSFIRYYVCLAVQAVEALAGGLTRYNRLKQSMPEKRPLFSGRKEYDEKAAELLQLNESTPKILRNFLHLLSVIGSRNQLARGN